MFKKLKKMGFSAEGRNAKNESRLGRSEAKNGRISISASLPTTVLDRLDVAGPRNNEEIDSGYVKPEN